MRCNKCGQFVSSNGKCDHCAQNNKKNTIMLLSLVFFVIFVFVGSMVYFKIRVSKTNIVYNRAIDTATELFNLSLFTLNEDVTYTFDINSNFELLNDEYKTDTFIFEIFNNLSSIITTEFNNEKEIMNITFDSIYSKKTLFNANLNFNNKNFYLLMDSYTDYIKIPINESTYNMLFNLEDFYQMFIEISDEVKNSFDDKYFSREIYFDSQDVKINEYILNLKGSNLKDFNIELLNNLKKNQKFMQLFSKLTGYENNYLIDILEDSIILIQEKEYSSNDGIIFHIYTQGISENFFSILIEYQNASNIKELFLSINDDETLFFEYSLKEVIVNYIEEEIVEEENQDDVEKNSEILEYQLEEIEVLNKIKGSIIIYNNQTQHKANINIETDIFTYQLNINRKSAKTNVSVSKLDSFIEYEELKHEDLESILNKFYQKDSVINIKEDFDFFILNNN